MSRSAAAPTPTWRTCSPCPRSSPTRRRARARPRNSPATTGSPPQRDGQPAAAAAETRDALAVLAGVLDRDGQQLSASQTWQQALADADHLAILHAIWTAETTPAREQHYRDLLLAHLPPEYRREPGHQARWLWRTLRAAELAGLDAGEVLAAAIGERDLAGARDLAAVIDARLRYRTGALVPAPAGPWSAQVPAIADPERHAYLDRDRRADGRAQGPHRRARRRDTPRRGRSTPWARSPTTR